MKMIKYICFLYLATFLILPAHALKSNEVSEEKYLIDHGHSDEIVRMIDLQKSRVEKDTPNQKKFEKSNRLKKFFQNLFRERDMTLPTETFGLDRIQTVESPER